MNSVTLGYDYPAIARQVLKISDFRQRTQLQELSLNKNFSQETARYYAVAAVIATAIEPQKAGAVAKKLLTALDGFQKEKLDARDPEEAQHCREEFVERFLKFEYDK